MRPGVLAAAITAAALTFSGISGAALASPVAVVTSSEVSPGDPQYDFVLWLAQYDERAMVRSTAWNALFGDDDVAAGIERFFATEWADAELLAEGARQRNKDFVAYVVATCVPAYSPEVCAAAQAASRGTDAQREAFVRTGYAAAKERDRRAREATGEQAAALVEADRAYVAALRDNDPGDQVRLAAAWALRDGATDSDLVEFFSHSWAHAAGLDVRAHRTELAKGTADWRRTIADLTEKARTAELEARDAAGEAAAQARAAASRAWGAVAQSADTAQVAWQHAEQVALNQAETWRQVAAAAAGAESSNWTPILNASNGIGEQWAAERQLARTQAAYWTGLYEQALKAEHAWAQTPA